MDEGPFFRWANQCASEIINIHMHSDDCKAIVYGKVLYLILFAMYEAKRELDEGRFEPSEN